MNMKEWADLHGEYGEGDAPSKPAPTTGPENLQFFRDEIMGELGWSDDEPEPEGDLTWAKKEIKRLQSRELSLELVALKAMLKYIEFTPFTHSCPVCGGNQYHDSACVLAAFLYPEKAESYKRNTGDTHINEMTFKIENDKRFEFLIQDLYRVRGYLKNSHSSKK